MAWLRLFYYQVVYWTVGTTPEAHHLNLAHSWYDLCRYESCIRHCRKYLDYKDSDYIKATMAISHGAIGEWAQAAATYRSISTLWTEPSLALGLAEAELQCGNKEEARKIVATVEVSHPNPTRDIAAALDYLNGYWADSAAAD